MVIHALVVLSADLSYVIVVHAEVITLRITGMAVLKIAIVNMENVLGGSNKDLKGGIEIDHLEGIVEKRTEKHVLKQMIVHGMIASKAGVAKEMGVKALCLGIARVTN